MLLQHGSSPGPSGTSSPKPLGTFSPSPKPPSDSPVPGTSSPSNDGASASASPRLGRMALAVPGSPRLGGASPRLGAGSPRNALEEEAALERLQTEMKEGWTVHTGRDGRLYYCNHMTRTAGWLPPAENWAGGCDERGEELPYGWEQAQDSRIKPYYINHANKTTTYVAPEGGRGDAPPEPRDVSLERSAELGFGFVAGSERPVVVRFVTDNSPSVGKLEPGDEILCVNGEDVRSAAREHVIAAVRACASRVVLRVCQPARFAPHGRKSTLLSAAKRARLRARPPRVRFADSVQVNGAPLFPPSAFSLGDLCLPPMANVLKVFLENGQTKSFKYDTTTTVQDVFSSLRDKLCIAAEEHFSLVVEHVKSLRRNKLTLLDPKESLARIASRPGAHKMRCLFRVTFVPSSAAELAQRDLAALEYLYLQCCNDVAQERFAPELQPEVALRLAALHMHQHAIANNVSTAKLTVKSVEREFGLERFVPSGLLENMKRKELRRLISHFLKLNSQMTGNQQKQLTQLQAKLHYLDIISSLPSYGAKCFSSNQPERVLLVSPKFGLSQIVGIRNSVPQPIANLDELTGVRLTREDELSFNMTIFLQRERVISFSMDDRDAAEMALVLAGYYRLATGQELNVDQEREPITEDIAPPYLAQHNVIPAKWSYLNFDLPMVLSKKHYAIFSMPPPYHSTPSQNKSSLDTNMNASIANRNHSANSSPLLGYDPSKPGLLGHDVHFEKCNKNEEYRLFDSTDMLYFDDGMGFDLHSILSMELLENASNNPKLVEARNEEVCRRVAEMQKLVENSEQYLTEQGEIMYRDLGGYDEGIYGVGKESSVDQLESDNESNNSRMSLSDDAPGVLKHSDSLILLTETINQGLSGLGTSLGSDSKDKKLDLSRRQSQGLSAILNNCGLTDALLALNNDLSQSESDNDSNYTPTSSPIHRHQTKTANKPIRTSFGLHSPESNAPPDSREQNLKEYLRQLREKNNDSQEIDLTAKSVPNSSQCDEAPDNDLDIIDLTLIPPPQTPDELDAVSHVPQILPVVPSCFADTKDETALVTDVKNTDATSAPATALDAFLATVAIQPPTVKVTPAVELTPEEILSYIIPPPPLSNNSTLDRDETSYINQRQIKQDMRQKEDEVKKEQKKPIYSNGDIVRGTLSVSEIRNLFSNKNLSEARNSLLLNEKNTTKTQQNHGKSDSPSSKRKSVGGGKSVNGNVSHVIEYPTVERKGMFSCCSKDKGKGSESSEDDKEIGVDRTESMPDVCEIRPPPRRKNMDNCKPPERPPKSTPTPVSAPVARPRSNSFTCPHSDLSVIDMTNNHFSTLNNRRLNYQIICDINEQGNHSNLVQGGTDMVPPPQLPPRCETKVLSPPPHILLPPKKPPLPPVPSIDFLRTKTAQRFSQAQVKPNEQRLASIGSPHFQRNLNTYKNLESEHNFANDDTNYAQSNGHARTLSQPHNVHTNAMTLQSRHTRSNSETKNSILKSNEMSTVLSLCSPQMNRKFSNRPDLLNGALVIGDTRMFSSPFPERKASVVHFDSASPTPKSHTNHVRFKEDVESLSVPSSPSMKTKFQETQAGGNGHVVTIEGLLCKTDVAVEGLLQRLHLAAQKCAHQHSHGGGEDIDEAKFQTARSELTSSAVTLVGTSRTLVGALGAAGTGGGPSAAAALADCLTPLRRLADLAQALGRHTSAPLQTRNLILRVHDVTAAFKDLAGAEMAQIFHDHINSKAKAVESNSSLEGQLALRAECLANVLATLLRSLRVFSP